jgi:hypothetical protein
MSKNNYMYQINYLKRAETRVILIIFNGVLCYVRAYTATVSYRRSTSIRYQKNYSLVNDCI